VGSFTKEQLERVRALAFKLQEGGKPQHEIAKQLNESGFKSPSGQSFNQSKVSALLAGKYRAEGRRRKKRKIRTQKDSADKKPKTSDELELCELVMASNISDSRKVAMLRKLLNG
jgi:hypothetical protein